MLNRNVDTAEVARPRNLAFSNGVIAVNNSGSSLSQQPTPDSPANSKTTTIKMVRVSSLTVQFRATYHHGGCDELGNDEQLGPVLDKAVGASDDLEHMSGIQAAKSRSSVGLFIALRDY